MTENGNQGVIRFLDHTPDCELIGIVSELGHQYRAPLAAKGDFSLVFEDVRNDPTGKYYTACNPNNRWG